MGLDRVGTANIVDGAVNNAKVAADAALVRSKLAEDSLARYQIPLMSWRNDDGTILDATGGVGKWKIVHAGWGTGTLELKGSQDSQQSAPLTYTMQREVVLPPEYVDGADIELNIQAKYSCEDPASCPPILNTIDAEVYELTDAGTVGADLNGDAVEDLTDSFADTAGFTIDGSGLVAGDRLMVMIRAAITAGFHVGMAELSAARAHIGSVELQQDVKG